MADRSVVIRLKADIAQFQAQMGQATASVKATAGQMTAADAQGKKWRAGLDTLGSTARNVGLVAAAGLGAAVLKAANFDQAMSNVQAATHETAGNMELLRAAALKAGADTVFSATEAAEGIENLAKAGVSTKDILAGGLSGALDLAAAGGLDVADAAEIAATALTQFNLSGKDVPHVADLLAAAAGKAQGEVSDMGMALKQSGLVASQMGVSIEETTGTLAAFASAGLLGSDAGTSFRTMLLRMANPSSEAADLMERLGISAYDAQGNFVGIADLAGQLQVAFHGQSQATRDAALATIFGSDAIRGANVLYKQGESGINGWTGKVNDAGYAAETAATKLDNLKGDMEALGGSLETALIGTGQGSQGALRGLVQTLTDVVNAYNRLPSSAQSAVGGFLAVTAAAGGGVWVFSKVVQGAANTREALQNLGVSAGSAKTALAGIGKGVEFAAIIAGLNLIDDKIQEVFHENLEQSSLGRSLTALGERGKVVGTLADTFGKDLTEFGSNARSATSDLEHLNSTLVGWVPFMPDLSFDVATRNIKQLDDALTGLVEGGNADAAKAAFSELAAAARRQGVSMDDLRALFPQYNTALGNAAKASKDATDATAANTGATNRNEAALRRAAAAEKRAVAARRETASSFLDISKNANKAKLSLNGWIRQMAHQAQALTEFGNNARRAADRGLRQGLIAALQKLGPEGALRMKQLANATDSQLKRANHAWDAGRAAARRYAGGVDGAASSSRAATGRVAALRAQIERIKGKIVHMDEQGAAAARARIASLKAQIDALHDKTVTVHYAQTGTTQRRVFDTGGYTGDGGKHEVAGVVHRGELVIPQELVRRDWAALKARYGGLPGFAGGGLVGSRSVNVSPNVNVGGPSVKVYLDGREIRHVARAEATDVLYDWDDNRNMAYRAGAHVI